MNDDVFMREALRLARKGRGHVAPNPLVGAVIVKNGRAIARGYHRRFGGAHAEVEALARAGLRAKGATLYVNLEPCRHFGKTPPCTEAILRAGITRVVCATRDPNGLAHGGIERLRRAGINVAIGILEKEARALNTPFYTFHEEKRPFITLKFAMSLDGKLGTRTGESKWITSEAARQYARRLRGEHAAVLVGIETVLSDDPRLTARARGSREPLRIVLDSRLRAPPRARVFKDANALVVTTRQAAARRRAAFEARGIRTIVCGGKRVSIPQLLARFYKMNIQSVLVEGGGAVLGSFFDAGLVDRLYAFYGPVLIGGRDAPATGGHGNHSLANALRFRETAVQRFGDSILLIGSR